MSYFRKQRSLSGLGASGDDCFTDQYWDPDKKQCISFNAPAAQPTTAPKKGFLDVFLETLTKPATAAPVPVVVQQAPSSGVSTTTLLVAGGAAVLLIALVASRN